MKGQRKTFEQLRRQVRVLALEKKAAFYLDACPLTLPDALT